MKVAGRYILDAPPDRVWPVIHDPTSLVRLIPGCEKLEQIGPAEYRGQMQLWLAAVAGKYETRVKLLESGEPYHPTSRSRTRKDHRLLTNKSDRDILSRNQTGALESRLQPVCVAKSG